MAQMERVSWRTVGYSMLGASALIAGTVGIVRSDGVRPTSLKSNSATRWLVDQPEHLLVLADGLTGKLLAKIDTESLSVQQVAYQGAGGAFLVIPDEGSVRAVSTAKLSLGTTQKLAPLSEAVKDSTHLSMGVGANGLTVVNTETDEASLVGANDAPRPIDVPKADTPLVARDGSVWLFDNLRATHVSADGSRRSYDLTGRRDLTATVGSHAVYVDARTRTLHWIDGGTVDVGAIPNLPDAIIQQPRGEDAPCVWLASGNALYCVGKQKIDTTVSVAGLRIAQGDRVAVAGNVAVIIHSDENRVERVDLGSRRLIGGDSPAPPPNGLSTTMISVSGIVWIDDTAGHKAWSVHDLGFETIDKNDTAAPLLDAQGQVQNAGSGDGGDNAAGNGNVAGPDEQQSHCDDNGVENPPVAIDDQVTARAGNTITIPVTNNDYDPDCPPLQAIALQSVDPPGHGTADVLDGTSVTYVPEQGYSGSDSFEYTIVDETGRTDTGTVNIDLFPPDSPNRPPITKADHGNTTVGRSVVVDVLVNDIDPERDLLTIPTFSDNGQGTITEAKGPSGLPALRFTPPPGQSGPFTFTYQAADPQGATSANTEVTVDVAPAGAQNEPPVANPDATRLKVGVPRKVNVKANDTDPDGDDLTIGTPSSEPGVDVQLVSQELQITLLPSAPQSSIVRYTLTDGIAGHQVTGKVLVLRIDDAANRPPVANPDSERVVIGSSVKIPVTANDRDPDGDTIRLLGVDPPQHNLGTATAEGEAVRFTPTVTKLDEATPETFTYTIGDGHGNVATGTVTVTILTEALPRPPIAVDDPAETFVDEPITIDVLNNDGDPSGGQPDLLGEPVCPNGGQAVVTSDKRVTFTPPSGLDGTFRCFYQVINKQRRTASASIIVTVKVRPAGNHPPTINTTALIRAVTIGDTSTFLAADLADDVDNDPLTFTVVSKPSLGSTNFSEPADRFTYSTPSPDSANAFPLPDAINIQISDGHGGVASGQISIRIVDRPVTPPSSTPPVALSIGWGAIQFETVIIDVPAQIAAANPGVKLTVVAASAANSSQAQVAFSSTDGTVSITPKVVGSVIVNYTVQNPTGQTDSGEINVTVTAPAPTNPPPVTHDDALTVSSGGTGQVNVIANDDGVRDPGDVVKVVLDKTVPSSFGSLSMTEGGLLTFTANPSYPGGFTFVPYTVSDGTNSADGQVKLTIEQCADSPPQAAPDPHLFTAYMTPIFIDLGKLAVSGVVDPSSVHGAINKVADTYTPPAGENSNVQIFYDVVNACNQRDPGVVTIDVNRAPTATDKSFDLTPGGSLNIVPAQLASDDETLTFSAINGKPDWVTMAADGTSITASPPPGTSGSYSFAVTVADPGGLTATATVTLVLSNQPPVAVDDVYFTTESLIVLGTPQYASPLANDVDPERQPLTILTVTPAQYVQGIAGGTVTLSVPHGVTRLDYTIQDAGGLTASAKITVTSNHAPSMADVSGETNQTSLSVTLSPTDPDSEDLGSLSTACAPLTGWDVQLLKDPSAGPPAIPDRVRAYITVAPGTAAGIYTFPCTTTDPLGASATATVTVTIDPT